MTVKDAFPSCFKNLKVDELSFWLKEFDEASVLDFLDVFEDKLESSSKFGNDEFHSLVYILLEDILSAKAAASQDELELLNFLQFYYGAECASFFGRKGIFTQAHDWLVWSISDSIAYGTEVEYQLERINTFGKSKKRFIRLNFARVYIKWMVTLFYYSRHFGGLKELAALILQHEEIRIINLTRVKGMDFSEEESLNLICQIIAWALFNDKDKAKIFVYILKDWIPNLERSNKKTAYLQLATGGAEYTEYGPGYYAQIVMEEYGALCRDHELLHASSIYYTSNFEEFIARPESLKYPIDKYLSSLNCLSRTDKIYEKGRIFGIINGLVMACLKDSKPGLALYLLSQYYEKGNYLYNHLFITLNLTKPGASYILEGVTYTGAEMSINDFRKLIEISNAFLGTKISLKDDPESTLVEPRHLGMPDVKIGPEFESILSKYYNLSSLQNKEFDFLTVLPGHQHPVQAMMIKELGFTKPINSSLEKPKKQRDIKLILLWCFGTLSSDREAELVSTIFKEFEYDVHITNVLEETKESFIEKYASEEYDVIWIATHGNYDHMLPHKSTLSILPDVEITIEEMFNNTPAMDRQRLLFLNVCDGATSATHDSLYEHGFGAGLASSSQCVISHLWPVETEPALFFGLLYAHQLSLTNSFWDVYSATIVLLSSEGKNAIANIAHYKEIDTDIIYQKLPDQIKDNIYYWGSAVYYC